MMNAAPGISIVIPAYNEEKYLPATLAAANAACERFTATSSLPAEIIVVNNASSDRTRETAEACGARVVDHAVRNISSVRNAGIQSARYEVIVTIDADSFLPAHSLEDVWATMLAGDCVGGALGVRVITDRLAMKILASLIQFVTERTSGISGAMFFFSREAALSFGGFSEQHLIAEDSIFAFELQRLARSAGKKFVRLRSVQVGTLDRKELSWKTVRTVIPQLLAGVLGRKQRADDLKYWYDPKR